MKINSLAELKAHLPHSEHDFRGRPFITEYRLSVDPDVEAFFESTRSKWTYVFEGMLYKLADHVTVK